MKKVFTPRTIVLFSFITIIVLIYFFSAAIFDSELHYIVLKLYSNIGINLNYPISFDNILVSFLITFFMCLLVFRGYKSFKYNFIFAAALSLLYLILFLVGLFNDFYILIVSSLLAIFTSVFAKKLYNIIISDKRDEVFKRIMCKYMSRDVATKILNNADKIEAGGVRKVLTILVVDIRNFTSISEELTPNDVASILNEYFSAIEPLIVKYKGVVNKYMGDGVLAIFGDPIQDDNHPINSVKCAFEIINCVKHLKEKFISEGKPKIDIGIAINTGEVFAGNIGTDERLEYTVIGDNVNLTYRIEDYNQALKTQFLISSSTYEFVQDYVEVLKLSHLHIKGKAKPIDVYEVLKLKDEQQIY